MKNENTLDGKNKILVKEVNYSKRNLYNARRKTMAKIPKISLDLHNF